ncbi:MAG TPA: hypothetical protein PJ994_03555 [Tepidiformaceae bacterium]|nr:hypothetical protein [Tepidiformaceae bacterium]HMO94669.1 hypothetical protein [Tepidiformaceae bacterium]
MSESLLHMVTLRHGPETCPAARPDLQEKCGTALGRVPIDAPNFGARVVGYWADPPGHMFFAVIEAPNAHAISNLFRSLELSHWNTVEVRPVVSMS